MCISENNAANYSIILYGKKVSRPGYFQIVHQVSIPNSFGGCRILSHSRLYCAFITAPPDLTLIL